MALEITAELREAKGRHAANRIRRDQKIPAVLYREGKIGDSIAVLANEWKKVLNSGQRIVTLKLKDGDRQALVKDVQYDCFGETTLHIDFNELKEGEKVHISVSLVFKGVPKGQAEGGVTNIAMHSIDIECLPQDIPDRITVDIEGLELDDAIHVSELKLPAGVVAKEPPKSVVVSVHEREEEAAPVEGAATEPEVLTAKKEDPAAPGAKPAAPGAKPAAGAAAPAAAAPAKKK
jgi:large subunit ribosomal protein L25